ncbi:hypothetical protein LPJ61_005303 [Coemansia biformis]|uniref:DUF2470 domain-containing protein n=1 Tax=Coemansia biformis TaxID=1286918 RepID=A0A9W7Y924_9FUNG|nr:hypothetical protein LPJ61_005303 [Coemansia biformis]
MTHQQTRRREQHGALSTADCARLKARLNEAYAEDILGIAQHFGKQPLATAARVAEVDTNGVRIEWEWAAGGSDGGPQRRQTEEMQFAIRGVSGPASVLKEVSDLAAEAAAALGTGRRTATLATDQAALGARGLVDLAFVPPSPLTMVGVAVALAALWHVALVDDVHPALRFVRAVASKDACYFILVGVVCVHLIEALAACAVCQLIKTFQPHQMSTATQLQWTVGGALFGVFCLHALAKKIARQLALADALPDRAGARQRAAAPGTS